MTRRDRYREFLEAKVCLAESSGFHVEASDVHPMLKPHQRDIVRWNVAGGRRANFCSFGLGKTIIQIETLRLVLAHAGGRSLIVAPLGVRQDFAADAAKLGVDLRFIRRTSEADAPGQYITNYEAVREGNVDPRGFIAASLDEAAILSSFGGTKTFREFMRLFAGDAGRVGGGRTGQEVAYRFVATATPDPNEHIEILSYAAFLGIMEVSEGKTRFFKRDATKADTLTLHPHKREEFWRWVASWAVFLQRPSDMGYSDDGYVLPPLDVRWHEIPSDHSAAGAERDGQGRLFRDAALGVVDASREKRDSLPARIEKLLALRADDPDAHRVIWHDLEAEREAIEAAIPTAVTVYGSQDLEEREQAVADFSQGRIAELGAKPVMLGAGCNLQRFCHWAIFLGIGFKFRDFIQAVHRLHRFLQTGQVRVDLIYTEAERKIREALERKWRQHEETVAAMTDLIREHGLANAAVGDGLVRTIGTERRELRGERFRVILNDTVEETRSLPDASVQLIVTSIPFSTQYEYTPSFNDMGHTSSDAHFFEHLGFLTPELLRVLEPGRVAAIHVKDRIKPGGINGLGFQTVTRFSDMTAEHFERHGFAFLGRKTVVTDVVRENNQTYRLGWTEQCKDGSRMGAGMPEYVLLFRRPPSDTSNGYADRPVVKAKKEWLSGGEPVDVGEDDAFEVPQAKWRNPDGYSRARWQLDAHGFMRSNGDRALTPEELYGLTAKEVYRLFKRYSLHTVYDFEQHVRIAEGLESKGSLPPTFMLLPPASWHPDVWADVARMRTLNSSQAAKGREMHLCPLQIDIADRLITQLSMPGEVVYDPFAGIGTVPTRAVKLGRIGWGTELNPRYWADACVYVEAAAQAVATPSLLDLLGDDEEAA